MAAKPSDVIPHTSQIIYVNHKDTSRLLEVFVTRSLSLNDKTLMVNQKRSRKKNKWVTLPHQQRIRRHSSDPSVHLDPSSNDEPFSSLAFSPVFEPVVDIAEQDNISKEKERKKYKKKKKKKEQKTSLWKDFLGLFSSKGTEETEEKDCKPAMADKKSSNETTTPQAQSLPQSPAVVQRKKTLKRRFSKKRLSLKRSMKDHPDKESVNGPSHRIPTIHVDVSGIESVEPTYTYYEKVSEEMEKIVHEVQDKEEVLTGEQVVERLAALMRKQGDAIEEKLNENPTLSAFFQKLSYQSFQQMADTYLNREAPDRQKGSLTTLLPTAPELVKLAFTLDFTARIAGLSRQNVGHIMGLGNRYLEDRFIYIQPSSDHPLSDND